VVAINGVRACQNGGVTSTTDPIEFTCPRCGSASVEEFYGPCAECRTQLRDTLGGDRRRVDVAEYVPKVNVTANAVALKDD